MEKEQLFKAMGSGATAALGAFDYMIRQAPVKELVTV